MSTQALPYFGLAGEANKKQVGKVPKHIWWRLIQRNLDTTHFPAYNIRIVCAHHNPAKTLSQYALENMIGLDADFEAMGSAPPNEVSRKAALGVLDLSFAIEDVPPPTYVTASAEGGVGIAYRDESKYAAIECLNNGEIWLLWYDLGKTAHSSQIQNNQRAIQNALEQIADLHRDAR